MRGTKSSDDWIYQFEENCMLLMPGTTLNDLDRTDSETLLSWYFWKVKQTGSTNREGIVYRNGRPYKRISANEADWTRNMF